MQRLTIEATSLESARGFYAALTGFEVELIEAEDGIYRIRPTLGGGDKNTLSALTAIERYVADRAAGPARIEMDGTKYTLEPAPDIDQTL